HEHLRVEQVGEVVEAERHPVPEEVDDAEGLDVALAGSRLHVLAAHVERVAACQLQHATQPLADRGFTRQLREPAAGRVPLPTTASSARARQAVGVDDHVADLAGESVGAADETTACDNAASDSSA